MNCRQCHRDGPDGLACTYCGAHQETVTHTSGGQRWHRYAAHPGEHVLQPSIVSTLFPHLGQHRAHHFRMVMLLLFAGIALLYSVGLLSSALLVAIVLLPLLYLAYMYEVALYRSEPLRVVGGSFGAGLVLGVLISLGTRILLPNDGVLERVSLLDLALGAVVLVVVAEVLKPLPVFFFCRRSRLPDTIDGMSLGISAGLGFALASGFIGNLPLLESLNFHSSAENGWLLPLVDLALLTPLVQAMCTGIVCAGWWRRDDPSARGHHMFVVAIAAAIVGHVAFSFVGGLLLSNGANQAAVVIWHALVVGLMMVYLRILVHDSLLAETGDGVLHPQVCTNCHRHVTAAAFCPACGAAMHASSRRSIAVAAPAAAPTAAERDPA